MSDSEDDFMSDKFLVDTPASTAPKTYSARRQAETLKSLRKGQENNKLSHKQQEEKNRREGLSKSLFETEPSKNGEGSNAALALMQKMGWKQGEGLGRKRSASLPPAKRQRREAGDDEEEQDDTPRGGLGSRGRARVEPIRVSLWAGRKGLSARSPSPPPLPTSRNPDVLDPARMARLGQATDDFRSRQRRDFEEREVEKTEYKAREQLIKLDEEKGVKARVAAAFHPLHVLPFDPLGTLPRPLLKLIYPASAYSPEPATTRLPSPPPDAMPAPERERLVSAAEKVREQMRKDMLSSLGQVDDADSVRFGIPQAKDGKAELREEDAKVVEENKVNWAAQVSGTKRVLSMAPREHLKYLLSQMRNEHMYCFWCSFKYKSFEEMDGPGGCPGEEEDDH